MVNKNKKIIIGLLALLSISIIMALAVGVGIWKQTQGDKLKQLGEIRQMASIDEYIESDPGLLHKKNAEALGLAPQKIIVPVSTQIPLQGITMAPIVVEGGDAVYAAVGELPNNKFFRLEPDNLNKIFSVNDSKEALKYIDFLMVTAGRSSYDRARTTVWKTADYDRIGCRTMPDEENRALPGDRPASQAKVSGDGYEVTWVFFTPTVPAGYFKAALRVEKDGGYSVISDPTEPFWPCGGGFVF